MAESSLDSVRKDTDIDVAWKAFELRPEGGPPPDPSYRAKVESGWPRVQGMGREYGLNMQSFRFGINTRAAHQAYKIVQGMVPEQADAYNSAIFRAYFQDGQDISKPDTLVALAEELGLDSAALRAGFQQGTMLDEVIQEEQTAYQSGITGVPAFVFMDKYLVSGVHPPENLRAIIQQIRDQEGFE